MNNPNDPSSSKIALSVAVFRILKSLAKFALRQGMSIGAMTELVRRAYLEAANEILEEDQAKVTTSQVCAMTGMYRKEVRRLEQLPEITDSEADDKYNRSSRVITGWLRDSEFTTKAGKPASLKLEGVNGFDALVRKYSGDMTPTAMRNELTRLGAISMTDRGRVKLETSAYLGADGLEGLHILGTDTADLIDTISHNLQDKNKEKRFQRKVAYTEIPAHRAPEFYRYAEVESQLLLEKLDRWLSKVPGITHPEQDECRLGVGVFHFFELQKKNEDDQSVLKQDI